MSSKIDMPGQRTFNELLSEPDENILVRCRVCRRPLRDVMAAMKAAGKDELDAIRLLITEKTNDIESLKVLEEALSLRLGEPSQWGRKKVGRKPGGTNGVSDVDSDDTIDDGVSELAELIRDRILLDGPLKVSELAIALRKAGAGIGRCVATCHLFEKDEDGVVHLVKHE